MVEVILETGDKAEVERALTNFKRKVARAGVLREVRTRKEYLKPSEKRKAKAKAARGRGRRRH